MPIQTGKIFSYTHLLLLFFFFYQYSQLIEKCPHLKHESVCKKLDEKKKKGVKVSLP